MTIFPLSIQKNIYARLIYRESWILKHIKNKIHNLFNILGGKMDFFQVPIFKTLEKKCFVQTIPDIYRKKKTVRKVWTFFLDIILEMQFWTYVSKICHIKRVCSLNERKLFKRVSFSLVFGSKKFLNVSKLNISEYRVSNFSEFNWPYIV